MTDQQIITALKLEALPEKEQNDTVNTVRNTVEIRLMGIINDLMSDEQQVEFEEFSESTDDHVRITAWIDEHVGNVGEMREQLLQDYIKETEDEEANH